MIAVVTVAPAFAGYAATYLNGLRLTQRQERLARVNRQLSDFCGPLFALPEADAQDSTGTAVYPSWLKLVRNGTTYSGYYSTDDVTWNLVGTIDVPTAAATQDVGLTRTSHASGTTGGADFDSFTTTP
ncbi:hypothetical protein [Streptomyces sp. STR69]|uniref:hypothetical protein n=1 Tax=Streptomyces sp. STR69 TaxID=1796942 RepID=UPI0021C84CA6|nr:hypothetical protein [Streptomyces sp. STR69]